MWRMSEAVAVEGELRYPEFDSGGVGSQCARCRDLCQLDTVGGPLREAAGFRSCRSRICRRTSRLIKISRASAKSMPGFSILSLYNLNVLSMWVFRVAEVK